MGGFNESVESKLFKPLFITKKVFDIFDHSKGKDNQSKLIGGYKESIYSKLDNYKQFECELSSHDKKILDELFKEDCLESDISFKSTNKITNKK